MKSAILALLLVACTTAPGPLVFRPEMHGSVAVPQAWVERVTESAKRWDDGLAPRCGSGMVLISTTDDYALVARLVPVAVWLDYGDPFAAGHGTGGLTIPDKGFGISGEASFLANPTWALESIQHEMGHVFGLGHNPDPTSIMYTVDRGLDMKPNVDDINAVADSLGCGPATSLKTTKPGAIVTN